MKRILLMISLILLVLSNSFTYVNAGFFGEIRISGGGGGGSSAVPYCKGSECGLNPEHVKDIKALETEKPASEYIQDVVELILGFLMLMATIIIIYAGFVLMFGLGDEDKAKKTKMIMIYAIIGLVIIYIAGPLSNFIFKILNG